MKSIIVDSGAVITLALNNLLWLLEKTKEKFNIKFLITENIKSEIVDSPLTTKKFKFEALQVMNLIKKEVIEVIHDIEVNEKKKYLLQLANSSFKVRDYYLQIVHSAEMSAVTAAIMYKADAVMIDERTTRYLIEKPKKLRNTLMHKLHTEVEINKKAVSELLKETKDVKFIRSAEFVAVAFEKGLLDEFLPELPNSREILLDALLWGLKLNGCAIAEKDLNTLLRLELKVKR